METNVQSSIDNILTMLEKGDFNQALQLAEQGIAKFGNEPNLLLLKGLILRNFCRITEALPLFEESFAKLPDAVTFVELFHALRAVGRAEDAARLYTEKITLFGNQHHQTPQPSRNGFKLAGQFAMENGIFEPDETELVKKLLPSSEVFINIGANIGYFTALALHQGIPTIAVEPDSYNLNFLYQNICANDWISNVEVYPIAVGDSDGVIQLYNGSTAASTIPGWGGGDTKVYKSVPLFKLDTIIGNRFSGKRILVMADLEGGEYAMLRGAEKLMSSTPRPRWILEILARHSCWPGGVNPNTQATFELFWKHGYQAYSIIPNSCPIQLCSSPISQKEISDAISGTSSSSAVSNTIFFE